MPIDTYQSPSGQIIATDYQAKRRLIVSNGTEEFYVCGSDGWKRCETVAGDRAEVFRRAVSEYRGRTGAR